MRPSSRSPFALASDLPTRLKGVLRAMPGPVALVTTRDLATGRPAGLAASAVIAVSMEPPAMLVCINRSASAHGAIEASGRFCINLIGAGQTALVEAFASSLQRDLRFASGAWCERDGLPYLPAAPTSLFCEVRTTLVFGTHEAFVGEVFDIATNRTDKLVGWVDGDFAQFMPMARGCQKPTDDPSRRTVDSSGALQ